MPRSPRVSASAAVPVCLALTSDQHTGSTVGVCPSEGVRLDDGGTYTPSKAQLWLWDKWQTFWGTVDGIRRERGAKLWAVLVGDALDGDHHATAQIISRNPDAQAYVANRVFSVIKDAKPDRLFMIRGTEAHTGSSGSAEEALAKQLGAERDAETENWSRWRLRLNINHLLVDFQHHGRFGARTWTRQNALSALAFQIWSEHTLQGLRPPDLAIRAHMHQFGDSYGAYPTRVIQLPAWQLKTAFAHRVAAENIADVGGVIVVVEPDGRYEVLPQLYLPQLPAVA